MAVSCVGCFWSRARREWRNWRKFSGRLAVGGHNAGLKTVGITSRWRVPGGDVWMAWSRDGMIDSNGLVGDLRGMWFIRAVGGIVRRFVKSKV